MQRRWLRNSPHLPGNPIGRGIALLRGLEDAAAAAEAATKPHWRNLRSRGMTTNQAAHARDNLGTWDQLSDDERAHLRRTFQDEGGLTADAFAAVWHAAMLERWSVRIRETNSTLAALEGGIEERRGDQARLDELSADGDADPATLAEARIKAEGAADEILALCQQCRTLQTTVVRDLLVASVDTLPDLMRRLLADGVFLPEDVREFRGFADAAAPPAAPPE